MRADEKLTAFLELEGTTIALALNDFALSPV
jgi:hypothetical protein